MRTISALLAASLLGNLVLFGLVTRKPNPSPAVSSRILAVGANVATTDPANTPQDRRQPEGNTWAELTYNDLHVLRDRLRAAGFPEREVRATIAALIDQHFAAAERELHYRPDASFWEYPMLPRTPELEAAAEKLARERRAMRRELLGETYAALDEFHGAYLRQMYGPFSPEKLGALRSLLDGHSERRREIASESLAPAASREQTQALNRELRERIATLLTPAELEQYEMRRSNTAVNARNGLETFNANESEYRLIYRLHYAWIGAFEDIPSPAPEQQSAQRSAREEMQQQLASALGAERYADYRQATNTQHQTLNRLVARFELPLAAARDAIAVQQDISRRAEAVRAQGELPPAQRTSQLNALAEEAQIKLSSTLGPRAFAAYQQTSGQWLSLLASAPAP